MGSVMTHRAGLLCGFFRAGNDVLFFDRLNPKTRRQIRQVGDNLELYQTDPPIPGLLGNDGLERNRRVAMPSSRVVVDDKDFLHFRDSATPEVGLLKSTLDAMWRTV